MFDSHGKMLEKDFSVETLHVFDASFFEYTDVRLGLPHLCWRFRQEPLSQIRVKKMEKK